jgi:hypothetical protein
MTVMGHFAAMETHITFFPDLASIKSLMLMMMMMIRRISGHEWP